MKKYILLLTLLLAINTSCKKEEKFIEPDTVLKKWAKALETLNYEVYRKCEAYPKGREVFREIYRNYYITDINISIIEDLDKEKVKIDIYKNSFWKRNVTFTAKEVLRKTGLKGQSIRGDVDFITFHSGKRKNDGWLMSNRTLIRINR